VHTPVRPHRSDRGPERGQRRDDEVLRRGHGARVSHTEPPRHHEEVDHQAPFQRRRTGTRDRRRRFQHAECAVAVAQHTTTVLLVKPIKEAVPEQRTHREARTDVDSEDGLAVLPGQGEVCTVERLDMLRHGLQGDEPCTPKREQRQCILECRVPKLVVHVVFRERRHLLLEGGRSVLIQCKAGAVECRASVGCECTEARRLARHKGV